MLSLCFLYLSQMLISLLQWNINTLVLESAQAREDRKKRVRSSLPCVSLSKPFFHISAILERAQKTCEITSTARWASTPGIDAITTATTAATTTSSDNTLSSSAYTCTYTHICSFRFGFVIRKAVHIGSSTWWNS